MYCMIKDEYIFDKYMIIWENVCNITKAFLIVNLYIIKNIEKLKKDLTKRKLLMFLYTSNIV